MDIRLAQFNPRVGDLQTNLSRLIEMCAAAPDADLVVAPEMALCGYPPQDLLDWPAFLDGVDNATRSLIGQVTGPGLLFGTVWREGRHLYNGAVLAESGREVARVAKRLLPSYDVFDERRWFSPGPAIEPLLFRGRRLGIHVCEDGWVRPDVWRGPPSTVNPVSDLVSRGADLLINLSASPWSRGHTQTREELCRGHARDYGCDYVLVNQVGGNDELIFDGGSLHVDASGNVVSRAPLFEEGVFSGSCGDWPEETACLAQALVLGVRDYAVKTGHRRAVIGLSGGIDSALVLMIAAEALGAEQVTAVAMPGPYSSTESLEDARALALAVGCPFKVFPIRDPFIAVESTWTEALDMDLTGLARQNVQARLRGLTLMSMANATGALVLATGNKSELATGYCTLQGDLCGALSVIGDLLKGEVVELTRWWRDVRGIAVPDNILTRPPSAELAPDQRDEDSLPPYPELDRFVHSLVVGHADPEVAGPDWPSETARHWQQVVDRQEYKRRQAPPVLRVTLKSFGRGRRRPLAQGFLPETGPDR